MSDQHSPAVLLVLGLALFSCGAPADTDTTFAVGVEPVSESPAPAWRRLRAVEYNHATRDLFGEGLVLPTSIEPDVSLNGLQVVGSSLTSVSAWGSERYEDAAYLIAEQALANPDWVSAHVPCDLDVGDAVCAFEFFDSFGRRVYRRPLTLAEAERLTGVVVSVSLESGDFATGLTYGLSGMLQSPHFLYRTEYGDGGDQLTDFELASRMSFLLWNTIPDDALLDAAAAGELSSPSGRRAQAQRMLADSRWNDGLRAMFSDVFALYELDHLDKDPALFANANSSLGPSAREETLAVIEDLVITQNTDFTQLMTTRSTFLDRNLASLYEVPAPAFDGFAATELPNDGRRRGLLGQASVLALHAHAVRSSATLRGVFVWRSLLCLTISPPPGDVDTSIPEADASSPTLRERLQTHQEDPACASCHVIMDGVGLGLENFDGVGKWRETENGAVIDPSGQVEGTEFTDAWNLGEIIRNNDNFAPCMVQHVAHYGKGQVLTVGEKPWKDWLTAKFEESGYRFEEMVLVTVASDGFARVGGTQ